MAEDEFEAKTQQIRNTKSETNSKCECQNVQNGHRHSPPSYDASNDLKLVSFEFLSFWFVSDF